VRELKTPAEVDAFLEQNPVSVLMFGASWCMPCKAIKPRVEKLGEHFSNVPLAYCDAEDHASGLVAELEIMSVPTVVVMVNGEGTEEVVGTGEDRIRKLFEACGDMIAVRSGAGG
jgi:thioredoxin 1